jgi:hypothetical protein
MGNDKKNSDKSRRWFLSLLMPADKKAAAKPATVKMLTAEGKLVEIDKTVLDEVAKKQKSTNKEIFDWMKNPSK